MFEHFLNVKIELEVIKELLTDDGILYIEVPGVMNIHNTYQKDFLRYLQNAHIRHFSHKTLKQMMKWNGFDEICGDETVRGIYKKGTANSKVIDCSDEILAYLKNMENTFNEQIDNPERYKELTERKQRNIEILDRWLTLNRNGKMIGDYFRHNGIFEVAIYGWGVLGKQLQAELEQFNIRIAYIIDQNADEDLDNFKVYHPTDILPKVDTILIAVSGEYYEIKQKIKGNAINVLTIQDIFNEVDI